MPTLVGTSTAPSSANSATTFSTAQTPSQAGAAAGDLLIAIGGHERTTQPTLGGVAGFTLGRAEEGTESAVVIGWKRLVAGDLGSAVTMTTAGSTRRGALAFLVLRDAGDPLFTNGPVAGGTNGQTTAPHPAATPATANAMLLSLMLAVSNVEPYARTFTSAAGWTEDVETGSSSTTSVNAFVYAAHTTGGTAGQAVTGNVVTASAEKFRYLPTTVVVPHVAAAGTLTVDAGQNRTGVAPGERQSFTATHSGGTAPRTLAIQQTAGPDVVLTREGDTWSYTAPRTKDGTTLTWRVGVTDSSSPPLTTSDTVTMTVAADPDVADSGGTPARPAAPDGWDEYRLLGPNQGGGGTGQEPAPAVVVTPVDQMAMRMAFLATTPTGTRQRYVATTGSDTAAGTSSAPFATIGRALADAQPGDQVLVRPGSYGYTRVQGRHGTPSAWITVMPERAGDAVTVRVPAANTGSYEALTLVDSDYVAVLGLEVAGSGALGVDDANADRSGVAIYGGVHHARFWGCHIHDLPGGGINAFCWEESYGGNGKAFDLLDLSYNVIHGTSRRSPSNTSGISINAAQDLTTGATWDDGTGIRIVGNHIYDVACLVPFTPGGYNIVTDGNGVSLDLTWDQYGYAKRQLVQDNLVHGCGARAVHAYGVINADVLLNTCFGNLINSTDSAAIAGDPEVDAEDGYIKTQTAAQRQSVVFHGNVLHPTRYARWRDDQSTYTSNVVLGGTQAVDGSNLDRRTSGAGYMPGLADPAAGFIAAARLVAGTPATVPAHARALPTTARSGSTWAAGALPATTSSSSGSFESTAYDPASFDA